MSLADWATKLGEALGLPPKLAAALVVLAVGLSLAVLARVAVSSVVRRATRLVAPAEGDQVSQAVARHRTDRLVGRAVFWLIALITLMAATEILGLPVVTAWLGTAATYLPKMFAAVLIAVAGIVVGIVARHALADAPAVGSLGGGQLPRVVQISIVAVSMLVAAQQLDLKLGFLTTLVAIVLTVGLAAGGLAFGLGSRTTIANILGMHYVRELYDVGQSIRVGDIEGDIVRFGRTCVTVETAEGHASVPGDIFAKTASVRRTRAD